MCFVLRCLLWVLLLLTIPSSAWATHEADHRFVVFGYVRDQSGQPVPDAKVKVLDARVNVGATAFTDDQGKYEALLHLHKDNLGDEIQVTALDETKTLKASFDPEDKVSARKVQVDFGAPAAEEPSDSAMLWVYAVGAALIVSVFLYRRRLGKKRAVALSKGWKGKKKK